MKHKSEATAPLATGAKPVPKEPALAKVNDGASGTPTVSIASLLDSKTHVTKTAASNGTQEQRAVMGPAVSAIPNFLLVLALVAVVMRFRV